MARGIFRAPLRTTHVLGARGKPTRLAAPVAVLAGLGLLTLASCAEQSAEPTAVLAPTLLVVTATAGPPPVPTPGEQQVYEVREGDTLSAIAARFGVTEDAIMDENSLSDPNQLFAGQELIIPPAQP